MDGRRGCRDAAGRWSCAPARPRPRRSSGGPARAISVTASSDTEPSDGHMPSGRAAEDRGVARDRARGSGRPRPRDAGSAGARGAPGCASRCASLSHRSGRIGMVVGRGGQLDPPVARRRAGRRGSPRPAARARARRGPLVLLACSRGPSRSARRSDGVVLLPVQVEPGQRSRAPGGRASPRSRTAAPPRAARRRRWRVAAQGQQLGEPREAPDQVLGWAMNSAAQRGRPSRTRRGRSAGCRATRRSSASRASPRA